MSKRRERQVVLSDVIDNPIMSIHESLFREKADLDARFLRLLDTSAQ